MRRKLAREIFVPTAVLGVGIAAALGFLGVSSVREARVLERDAEAVRDATALALSLTDAAIDEVRWMSSLEAPPDPGHPARVAEAGARVAALAAQLEALALAPRAAGVLRRFLDAREALRPIGEEALAAARRGDGPAMAAALDRWHLLDERADRLLRDFTAFHLNRLDRSVADLERRRTRTLAAAAGVIAAGLVLAAALAALIARTVVRPIVEMAAAARRIQATGAASPVGGAERRDELGVLARAFNEMTGRLVSANDTLAQTNEALRAAHARLEDADQRKNQFLAVLSHELRNPLAPIENGLHILDRVAPGSEQARRTREVIARQVDQLARLVDDLLDVTRITRGKIQLQPRRLELNELVRRTFEDHRSVLERAGVEARLELAASQLFVTGDPNRVAQIIGNLLQNAAKFTPRGGRVSVAASADDAARRAVVRVTDTGSGMEPEVLARVFEPFMQADTTLDRSKGGLGLGLALVKGLVEQHGGSVEARSDGLGRGAEFTVRLPLEAAPARELEGPAAAAAGARRRVLVVEDIVDAADSLREMLELAGHEVAVAYDGREALARARAFRPEVVICDIGLPGMDGYAVARAFRGDGELCAAHLVALSGYALPEDLRRAAEAGFDRHLAKPAGLETLEAVIDAVCAAAQPPRATGA